ncbi:hypothetical protein VTP01DRAFT_3262 [Rhizomucor pusillus]|uniref:uncharacterized protein n=1 Tax=Rhizomucor pusillus TaxID=4840 RepID=UPI003744092B
MASVEKKSNNNMKRVQFSCHVEHVSTFANEEYDRTAQEVARLTYHDMLELLTLKSEWRRQMESMLADRRRKEQSSNSEDNNNDELETVISPAQHEICA